MTLEDLGYCSCMDIAEYAGTLAMALRWFAMGDGRKSPLDRAAIDGMKAPAFYLIAGLLDQLNLIEHGGSIRGAWLTERGDEALALCES